MAKLCLHHGFYMHGASVLKQKIAQLHQPKAKANQKHNAKMRNRNRLVLEEGLGGDAVPNNTLLGHLQREQ